MALNVLVEGLKPPLVLDVLVEGLNPPILAAVEGLKPPLALDVLAVGLKAFAENRPGEALVSFDGVNWKPTAGAAGFAGSGAGAVAAFGVKRVLGVEDACGLLPIALANRFDVAVAGGLALGGWAAGWGVGVAGGSAGRARLVGEACRSSGLPSSTLRLVDNDDSLPVTPFAAARSFLAISIFVLIAELRW
jgi:hypothetical protein